MKFSAAIAALATVATVSAAPTKRATSANDMAVLNFALTLEYFEAAYYKAALKQFKKADFSSGFAYNTLVQIGAEEMTHASTIASLLGNNAVSPCNYTFDFTSVDKFVKTAIFVEGTGVSAYIGAAPLVEDKTLLEYAAQILPIEARHNAFFYEYDGISPSPGPFDTPLSPSEAFTLVAPYLQDCPSSNAAKLPPLTAYPALYITKSSGNTYTFSYDSSKTSGQSLYINFSNGIQNLAQPLKNGQASIPSDANFGGRVYATLINGTSAANSSIIAGPAVFRVDTYPQSS